MSGALGTVSGVPTARTSNKEREVGILTVSALRDHDARAGERAEVALEALGAHVEVVVPRRGAGSRAVRSRARKAQALPLAEERPMRSRAASRSPSAALESRRGLAAARATIDALARRAELLNAMFCGSSAEQHRLLEHEADCRATSGPGPARGPAPSRDFAVARS
jgi:hypothetical protein